MPRKAIDYSKGLIYQIEKDGIIYYVGSTTSFIKRKSQHKTVCNNVNSKDHNFPIYKFIRDNGGWDEFKMVLIEYYKCNDSNELEAREQHWINEFKTYLLLNSNYASRTNKQYYIDNKKEIAIKALKYNRDNKEAIAIKSLKYRQDNREAMLIYQAKYRLSHKTEKIIKHVKKSAYNAKYYQGKKMIKLLFKMLPFHL